MGTATKARAYIDRKSSPPTEAGTPPELYDRLDRTFGPFTLDPAANCGGHGEPRNVIRPMPHYCLGCGQNGLGLPWHGKVYVNPPFDKSLPMWVAKARIEIRQERAHLVAMLLPVRTGRKWWQEMAADHIIYLPGRLRFVGETNSAPFDTAVALWWQL